MATNLNRIIDLWSEKILLLVKLQALNRCCISNDIPSCGKSACHQSPRNIFPIPLLRKKVAVMEKVNKYAPSHRSVLLVCGFLAPKPIKLRLILNWPGRPSTDTRYRYSLLNFATNSKSNTPFYGSKVNSCPVGGKAGAIVLSVLTNEHNIFYFQRLHISLLIQ